MSDTHWIQIGKLSVWKAFNPQDFLQRIATLNFSEYKKFNAFWFLDLFNKMLFCVSKIGLS